MAIIRNKVWFAYMKDTLYEPDINSTEWIWEGKWIWERWKLNTEFNLQSLWYHLKPTTTELVGRRRVQYISNVNASSYKTNKGEKYGLMIICAWEDLRQEKIKMAESTLEILMYMGWLGSELFITKKKPQYIPMQRSLSFASHIWELYGTHSTK